MLIEFSVENYKSFRDRTTFSMIAANIKAADPKLDEENVIPVNHGLSLLSSAAIYGKNASGKSNFGAALRFVRSVVLLSANETQAIEQTTISPFMLDVDSRDKPSIFEIVFFVDDIQFRYGFEILDSEVFSEYLYYVPSRREYLLFERDGQEISVKSAFKEGRGLEKRTRANALFLSVVAQFNGAITTKILAWFQRMVITSGLQDNDFNNHTAVCLRKGINNQAIRKFVSSIDVDIDDLFTPEPPKLEELPTSLSEEQRHRIIERSKNQIFTGHHVYDRQGQSVGYEWFSTTQEESQGTRKLIAMAGPLHTALEHGYVLFIDEMDARLHTQMTEAIVRLFHSKHTNPHGAQLIFVTHDTNLLSKSLFRRDQIWFVQKDRQGGSSLISLAEFKERNDADFERRYLEGRYGAVPFIRNPDTDAELTNA